VFGSISQRRTDIEIYELVGATQMYIIKPFLVEGLWMGAITGGFAVVLTYLFHLLKESVISSYLGFFMVGNGLQFFSSGEIILFISTTAICSLLSSYLSVRKISSGWAAAGGGQ
jgi:cell division protein FtsX